MNYKIYLLFFFISLAFGREQLTLIEQDAKKFVFIPKEDIGDDWKTDLNFDDSDWQICEGFPGGIGYEKSSGYEEFISLDVSGDMYNGGNNPNTGCYIRIPFELTENQLEKSLVLLLNIRYDDGFVAYLNGHECAIMNSSRFATWDYAATHNHEATSIETIDISNYIRYLTPGENFLAIHGVNTGTGSSDFLILPELVSSEEEFENFEASPLPIFMIDTDDNYIPDEPKIDANLKIIYDTSGKLNHPTDSTYDYNGHIGIEIRGSYSATFPQKPYGIETRDEAGENNNVSLLGFPKENDWILIPNYNDKAFVRNSLAFELFRSMGHYAPRSKLCEVFVNKTYRGMYLFTEKIKRDNDRIDISKLKPDELDGDDLTGGYIFKIDYYHDEEYFRSDYTAYDHPDKNVYFVYDYPKPRDIADEQRNYIQSFTRELEETLRSDDFDDPLTGYRSYLDVNSFIDYFIISEVSRNVDGYKKSRWFFKDKDSKGGLLHAGPVWDFDWAWKNISEGKFGVKDGSNWSYNHYPAYPSPPYWYVRLLQDKTFTDQLINRYQTLRQTILSLDHINAYIDSVVTLVNPIKDRHFDLWPIDKGYMTPESDPRSKSYEQEIAKLKHWIETRINWLDINIPKLQENVTTAIDNNKTGISTKIKFKAYPNPAISFINFESNRDIETIKIYNLRGQQVYSSKLETYKNINIQRFPKGLYFIKITFKNQKPITYKHLFL